MRNKVLRVMRWQIFSLMRAMSKLVRDFFTPREVMELITGYKQEPEYKDYPLDFTSPKLISENTLKKMMNKTSNVFTPCAI